MTVSKATTRYELDESGEYLNKLIETSTSTDKNNPAVVHQFRPYHQLRLSVDDGELINDGTDTETVTVELIDGLQVVRGNTPADVIDAAGDVILKIDGGEITKSLIDGAVSFEISTSKPIGSTIVVRVAEVNSHPSDSESVSINVV
jgi:hypothetical protein